MDAQHLDNRFVGFFVNKTILAVVFYRRLGASCAGRFVFPRRGVLVLSPVPLQGISVGCPSEAGQAYLAVPGWSAFRGRICRVGVYRAYGSNYMGDGERRMEQVVFAVAGLVKPVCNVYLI